MLEIYALLQCLTVCLDATSLRQLGAIVPAFLSMTGRVTMLGISRWTDEGGSYRTCSVFSRHRSIGASSTGVLFVTSFGMQKPRISL